MQTNLRCLLCIQWRVGALKCCNFLAINSAINYRIVNCTSTAKTSAQALGKAIRHTETCINWAISQIIEFDSHLAASDALLAAIYVSLNSFRDHFEFHSIVAQMHELWCSWLIRIEARQLDCVRFGCFRLAALFATLRKWIIRCGVQKKTT